MDAFLSWCATLLSVWSGLKKVWNLLKPLWSRIASKRAKPVTISSTEIVYKRVRKANGDETVTVRKTRTRQN